MKDFEFREFEINNINTNEEEMTLNIDLSQSKRFSNNNRFTTESINPKTFVKGIKSNAVILLNHNRQMVVSNQFEAKPTNNGVEVIVKLDKRNVFATTCMSYRENNVPLSVSFGFKCNEERMIGKHREVLDLEVSELSILTVESAYPSSVRCLENNEIRELTIEELQEMINKSVQDALKVKEESKEEVKVKDLKKDIKEEQKPIEPKQVDTKPIEVKLNTDDLKNVFNDFLDGFKSVMPKHEVVKEEQKVEVKAEEPKVEEKPTKVDDEKIKADIEKYKQMLAELE